MAQSPVHGPARTVPAKTDPRIPGGMYSTVTLDVRGLERAVTGEVCFDPAAHGMSASDASNYRHMTVGVVVPKTLDEVVATHRVCAEFDAPIKPKRVDLRRVGLGRVVTRDAAVPVTSHADPGNRPDVTQFSDLVDELVARFHFATPDPAWTTPTVVFDAGQNSAANFAHPTRAGLHFLGSLPPFNHLIR
ncbi:MAG: hypothetical protein ACR2K2_03535 [Mycobacteriales bacterium]